jgi:hypothetical protein
MKAIHESRVGPRTVAIAAALGALSLALSTAVSISSAAGVLPPLLYGTVGDHLATLIRWNDLPAEFYGLAWFTAILVASTLSGVRQGGAWNFVFLTAVPVTGIMFWVCAIRLRVMPVVPLVIASGACAVILTISGSFASNWRWLPRHLWIDFRSALSAAAFRAVLLVFVAAVMAGAVGLRAMTTGMTASDRSARSYRNWYLASSESPPSGYAVRIVVFSDPTCPACVAAVWTAEALLDAFAAETHAATDLVIRDLPRGGCQEPTLALAPVPCLAAAAVHLIRERQGSSEARRTVLWLSREYPQLSTPRILDRLRMLGLADTLQTQWTRLWQGLSADAAEAARLGVEAAPSIVVNGARLPGATVSFLQHSLRLERERLGPRNRPSRP